MTLAYDLSIITDRQVLIVRVDMEMHRCLPVLQEQNMGAGKTAEELEKDRPLVIGARVWLAVSSISLSKLSILC